MPLVDCAKKGRSLGPSNLEIASLADAHQPRVDDAPNINVAVLGR
jgi:hypothetical protein